MTNHPGMREREVELAHEECKEGPQPGEVYKHYRTGQDYEVVARSVDERTLLTLVTYRERHGTRTWTRPVGEFLSNVAVSAGGSVKRFECVFIPSAVDLGDCGDTDDVDRLDLGVMQRAIDIMKVRFDTVMVFCTRHDNASGTVNCHLGCGNWFARMGHVEHWLGNQKAVDRQRAILRADLENED